MTILYGYRTRLKREGDAGVQLCPNCGHRAPHTYARLLHQGTLFGLPIFGFTAQRGTLCECCGEIQPLPAGAYKDELNHAKLMNGQG